MRVWDLDVSLLCRPHLLGEHRELHAIWTILTKDRPGYRNHPEVKRWENHLDILYVRHLEQVAEMMRRGWNHRSDLDIQLVGDRRGGFPERINTIEEQHEILKRKGCTCRVQA